MLIFRRRHTAEKVPVFGVILVRVFPAFSRIPTEYGEIRSTKYLRIQSERQKMRENRITPNKDTFYAVVLSVCHYFGLGM